MTTMATPSPVPSSSSSNDGTTTSTKPSAMILDQDVPIFLRKTFHLVNTCDPDICGWSEDGETFLIKDPSKFETTIIPQFFKHNKFASFVRQLNFYSFRKLKHHPESLLLADEQVEESYWRFYHPKFQRGRPEWLKDIKRMVSNPRKSSNNNNNGNTNANGNGNNKKSTASGTSNGSNSNAPTAAASSASKDGSSASDQAENLKLKTEVTSLKERIEAMTKNIDQLTDMVQKVTLHQQQETPKEAEQQQQEQVEEDVWNGNHKRIKRELSVLSPDDVPSSSLSSSSSSMTMMMLDVVDDSVDGGTVVVDDMLPDIQSSPLRGGVQVLPPLRETSQASATSSELSDEAFVEKLFTEFGDDQQQDGDDVLDWKGVHSLPKQALVDAPTTSTTTATTTNCSPDNRPRVELMERLSDALSLLPRDIQELVVDRFIQAILSPKKIQETIRVSRALDQVLAAAAVASPSRVPQSPRHVHTNDDGDNDDEMRDATTEQQQLQPSTDESETSSALPLAAATLAALLARYGKESSRRNTNDDDEDDDDHHDEQVAAATAALKKSKEAAQKSLLIPVHA